MLESARKRVPFKFSEGEGDSQIGEDVAVVLDEQEQEDLIHTLRGESASLNRRLVFLSNGLLILVVLFQVSFLFSSSKISPIVRIFPPTSPLGNSPLSYASALTILALVVVLNLAGLTNTEFMRTVLSPRLRFVPFSSCYVLSTVAPLICFATGERGWQTNLWWALCLFTTTVVHTTHLSIVGGINSIRELERLKYTAPGA